MLIPVVIYLLSSFAQPSQPFNVSAAKCCGKTHLVQEVNRTLECRNKTNTRYQILADSYNFLVDNSDGNCIDFNGENFYAYEVSDSKYIKKELILDTFPKCCPFGYIYNPQLRACSRNENVTENFVKGNFVKIGLPQCRLILDKTFEQLESFEAFTMEKSMKKDQFCVDSNVDGNFVIRECQNSLSHCEKTRCFKKCCPDGQSYVGGGICKDTYEHGLTIDSQYFSTYIENSSDSDYHLIYGAACPKVSLLSKNKIQYTINHQGTFRYFYNYSAEFVEDHYSSFKSYCIEHARKGNISGYKMFFCYGDLEVAEKFSHTLWAKILSCILLLMVIFIYVYLGEIRSTFGKILINYCIAMLFLMGILSIAHVSLSPPRLECKLRGYSLIFFHCAAFAWVNVMSLDIWWTFGTPRRTIGNDQKRKDLKKFMCYLLYGWGLPLTHTTFILIFETTKFFPESIQPYVGIFFCILEKRNHARTIFFHIPQFIFQFINTVLFIKTIIYCMKVKNEINKMNDSARSTESGKFAVDKERLGLIFKLAVIMGVIWIFEVITAFFQNMKSYSSFTKYLEIILDTVTCLQGVFIFIIFICKKKTITSLRNKLGFPERRISSSLSTTQTIQFNGHFPMNKRQTTMSINEQKL